MKFQFPRVLVIDDDEAFSSAISRWLSQLGYQPEVATSAAEGIARLESGGFDALLLDLQLPDLHGHAILRQLNGAGSKIPVIVVSGTQEMDDVLRVWRQNAADFLRKPFRIDDLAAALDTALRRNLGERARGDAPLPPTAAAPEPTRVGAATLRQTPVSRSIAPRPLPVKTQSRPPANRAVGLRSTVKTLIEALKDGTMRLPILDPSIIRLPEYLTGDNWTVDELVDTLTRDSNLAAAVLRSANSAAFSRGKVSTSLREACTRLGSKAIVTIAFETTVKNQFTTAREPFRSILKESWRNAVVTSRMAPLVGELMQFGDQDELRLLGLFHNLGEQLCVCLFADLDKVDASPVHLDQLSFEVESLHEELGMKLAASWKLPTSIVRLAGHHHRPVRQPEPQDQKLTRYIILAAWSLALRAGFTYLPSHANSDNRDALTYLGLSDEQTLPIFEKCKTWQL